MKKSLLLAVFLMSCALCFGQSRSKSSSLEYVYVGTDVDLLRVNRPYAPNLSIGVKNTTSSRKYIAFELNGWYATQEEKETVGGQTSIRGEEKILSINGLVKFGFSLTKNIKKGFNTSLFTGLNYWSSETSSFTELYYPISYQGYNIVAGVEPEYIIDATKNIDIVLSVPVSIGTIGYSNEVIGDPTRPVEENTTKGIDFNYLPQYSLFRVTLQIAL